MTDKNEKRIEKLEEKIAELEEANRLLREDLSDKENAINGLGDDLDMVLADGNVVKLARAVCELQEELRRKFPDLYFINNIDAPTKVGQS